MDSENLELSTKIFQNNPLPMSITSIEEGQFLAINSRFTELLGYDEEEILGRTVGELNFFIKPHKEKIIKKEIKNQEALIRSKDGKVLNGIFTTETINIQGEEAILGVMVDITEKVKLIEDTRDKYEKLTNIIQGTNLGTWEWNMDTGKLKINEQWANILGYKLEELEPTTIETWYDFTHPEDLKLAKLNLKEHFEKDKGYYHNVIRMKHKSGSWIWVDDRGKITKRDHRGKPLKMFGTHIDITEWQNQKLELERFFSINLDLLCIVDIEGHFIKLNKAWEEVLGYSEEELKGRNILDFIHKEDIEDKIAAMGQLQEGKKVTSFTNRYRCVNDEYRYIEWRSNRYEDVIYGAARDVTEKIEYENKLLESSNRDALCVLQ